MQVPVLLLGTLEDLRSDDFEKFKWYLSIKVLDSCEPIPRSRLESPNRTDTVRRMIESYGEDGALDITVEILKMMGNRDAADRLKKRHAEGQTAAPPPAAAAVAPPAPPPPAAAAVAPPAPPATMLAQQGSMIIAPTVSGGTSGTWNITINK